MAEATDLDWKQNRNTWRLLAWKIRRDKVWKEQCVLTEKVQKKRNLLC